MEIYVSETIVDNTTQITHVNSVLMDISGTITHVQVITTFVLMATSTKAV
jgi:hypothetical protein